MKILVLNAGSSSQKSTLYELSSPLPDRPPAPLWQAQLDWTRHADQVTLTVQRRSESESTENFPAISRLADTERMLATLWTGTQPILAHPSQIDAVGHRIVHGGALYPGSTRITSTVKTAIADLAAFAPIHNPVNLQGIEMMAQILHPEVPQVAVFDTAFHQQMPPAAATYALPYTYWEQGIRRYGFHGTSHHYCAQRAGQLLGRDWTELRLIVCHLGNGCSLAAIRDGHSVDTTMGFTPLEGLMMGTRSGSVDPGILIHLMRQEGATADDLDRLLNKEAGLKGLSGLSADMRQIIEAIATGHDLAQLAFDVFIHRLRSHIGAMLASLGRLDALIFTAGIGENAAIVRTAACAGWESLGLHVDEAKNGDRPVDQDIATPDSAVRILVIHTQEDWAIAQETYQVLQD